VATENGAGTVAFEDRATCPVCEKLRQPLVQLIGIGGFRSLLQRALTLAQRESPALAGVEVLADGSLSGLEGAAVEAVPILIAHLIQLLITFIGESLTRTLLQDIWPEIQAPDEPTSEDGYEK